MSQSGLEPRPRRVNQQHGKVQTSVWLAPTVRRRLQTLAINRGQTMGDLIRDALRDYLEAAQAAPGGDPDVRL